MLKGYEISLRRFQEACEYVGAGYHSDFVRALDDYGKRLMIELGIPKIDPFEWAHENGLKIKTDPEEAPKIECYKAVHTIYRTIGGDPSFIAEFGATREFPPVGPCILSGFEYAVGQKANAPYFDDNPLRPCAPGLHATRREQASSFGAAWDDTAILTLLVNPSDCIVPYETSFIIKEEAIRFYPAKKFRAKECLVVEATSLRPIWMRRRQIYG